MPPRAFAFCIALAATIAWAAWPLLGSDYAYRDFVVGTITLTGERKSGDYAALVLLCALSLLLLFVLHRMRSRLSNADATDHLLGLALLPLVVWLGASLTGNAAPRFPYAWAIAAATVVSLMAWRWRRSDVDDAAFARIGEHVLASMLVSLFAGLGLALALFHASGHAWPRSVAQAGGIAGGVMIVNAAVVALGLTRARAPATLQTNLQRWLVLLQFAFPLLGLVLLPPQLHHRGSAEPYAWPWLLLLVLLVCAAVTWSRLARRWHRLRSPEAAPHAWLEPMALAMLAVFLSAGRPTFELLSSPGYPTIFGDEFHLGEQVLPWQQWLDFQRLPYADFAPVHGLMPLLTGALDALFFDGTLAHMNLAFAILVAVASALTVLLACRAGNRILALALCFVVVPLDRLLFVAPALLLIADAALLARPGAWLATWAACCVFMLGYNAAIGSAFTGGTALVALVMTWRLLTRDRASRRKFLLWCAGAILLVALAGPLRRSVLGFVAFLYENGTTNMVGHGIPWLRGWTLPGRPHDTVLADRLLFDLLRLAWIVVALYASWQVVVAWRAASRMRLSSPLVLSFATGITLLVLSAWSLGRIDPEIPSRTGAVSFLAVGTLLPVLHVAAHGWPRFASLAVFALVAALLACMHGLNDRFAPQALVARAVQDVEVPRNLQRVNGVDLSSPRLGTVFVSGEQAGGIAAFRDALGRVLAPGQTYFDFTNRQALYYYSNHAVPALYSATFNALNEIQQRRMLRQLAATPPAAVFVAPALEGDGISASLRSFHLYRHFARTYRPVSVGGFVFLVNASSPAYVGAASGAEVAALLDDAFAHPDLQWLPASWGQSWPRLEHNVRSLGDLVAANRDNAGAASCSASGGDAATWVWIGRYEASTGQARSIPDLLEIRLAPSTTPVSALRLVYASPNGAQHTIDMRVRGSTLIVPVSSYPSWLRAESIPAIDVCARSGGSVRADAVTSLRAWAIPELAP